MRFLRPTPVAKARRNKKAPVEKAGASLLFHQRWSGPQPPESLAHRARPSPEREAPPGRIDTGGAIRVLRLAGRSLAHSGVSRTPVEI
jgi:hypothetical protein